MNLTDVIEGLVEERGLEREKVIHIVREGISAAYKRKFPDLEFDVMHNKKTDRMEVFVKKQVVASVEDDNCQVSFRRARTINPDIKQGDMLDVPFSGPVGRIEVLTARQVIAQRIKELEQSVVFSEFAEKEGALINGVVHKRERNGYSVKVGDYLALLPRKNTINDEIFRTGAPVRVLLKTVGAKARGDYQLILDRASSDFVKRLLEAEIPEVFEGLVEVKKIVRIAGYKTKVIVGADNKEIDPVGACVGMGGIRIKPILKELGREKIDLIEWTDDLEELVKQSLKPAEIDKVEISGDGRRALVWLVKDQRSYAIGKMGQNITLASRLTDLEVKLQSIAPQKDDILFDVNDGQEMSAVRQAERDRAFEELQEEAARTMETPGAPDSRSEEKEE